MTKYLGCGAGVVEVEERRMGMTVIVMALDMIIVAFTGVFIVLVT